jgi:uncharacterized integral membrane protein (TIGR00697 family)
MPTLGRKKQNLFMFLSALFLTNAIVAEIIGVKIFSLEQTLGFNPAQIPLLGKQALDFNLSAGVMIWPVVFITSDLINEYFGKAGVRKISYMAAGFIAYMFVAITLVTYLTPASFWVGLYKGDVNNPGFDINMAFSTIFRQGLGIILGSLTAFLIGQLLDVMVFHWLRSKTGSKMIWLRATGSTLVSQLIDSFVVLVIAFKVFGIWSWDQVIAVSIINYIYKGAVAIGMTPVLYLAHNLIDKYLGDEASHELQEAANDYGKELV